MSKVTENAIQSDASAQLENQLSGDTSDSGAENAYVSPRQTAMDLIADQRRASLAKDGVDVSNMEGSAAPVADPDIDVDSNTDQLVAQLTLDDRPQAGADMRVKVKIDGEELELPLSEVINGYQKNQTASQRLTEATRLLALAKQETNKIAQKTDTDNNSPNPSDVEAKAGRLGQIKGAFSKLYEGDEDGAAQGLLEILEQGAKPATPAINPATIVTQVRQQLAVESAYKDVKSDYPELFLDTERGAVLGRETVARMNDKISAGVSKDQALQESAEEVAGLFGIKKTGRQTATPPRTARDTKLERKAELDSIDSANVVAGNTLSPAEAPNVSRVIQEMAAGRLGQSIAVR